MADSKRADATLKKLHERMWLERLLDRSGLAFVVDDDREEAERPDFLVRWEGERVGIEISEVQIDRDRGPQQGSRLQQEHSLRESVISRAKHLYIDDLDSPVINVGVVFNPSVSLVSVSRRDLTVALVRTLRGPSECSASTNTVSMSGLNRRDSKRRICPVSA